MIDRRLTRKPRLSGKPIKADPQRHRVYSMERTIVGQAVGTHTDSKVLNDIVRHACREWGVERPNCGWSAETRPSVYGSCDDDSIRLNPLYDGDNTAVLLHELAHWLTFKVFEASDDLQDHGPEFMGVYRYLLDRYNMIPSVAFDALMQRWDIEYLVLKP